MRQIITALQSILAPLHSFDKLGFVVKVLRKNILHKLVGVATFLSSGMRQLRSVSGVK